MNALKGNDEVMIQMLREMLVSENVLAVQHPVGNLPNKANKAFVATLHKAVQSNDVEQCKSLYAVGSGIDFSKKGCSPLRLALELGNLEVAEWLLDNAVDTTPFHAGETVFTNLIPVCLRHSKLCTLLTKMVDHYIYDASGWPFEFCGHCSAIWNQNMEGLSMLLKLIKEKSAEIRYCY